MWFWGVIHILIRCSRSFPLPIDLHPPLLDFCPPCVLICCRCLVVCMVWLVKSESGINCAHVYREVGKTYKHESYLGSLIELCFVLASDLSCCCCC